MSPAATPGNEAFRSPEARSPGALSPRRARATATSPVAAAAASERNVRCAPWRSARSCAGSMATIGGFDVAAGVGSGSDVMPATACVDAGGLVKTSPAVAGWGRFTPSIAAPKAVTVTITKSSGIAAAGLATALRPMTTNGARIRRWGALARRRASLSARAIGSRANSALGAGVGAGGIGHCAAEGQIGAAPAEGEGAAEDRGAADGGATGGCATGGCAAGGGAAGGDAAGGDAAARWVATATGVVSRLGAGLNATGARRGPAFGAGGGAGVN